MIDEVIVQPARFTQDALFDESQALRNCPAADITGGAVNLQAIEPVHIKRVIDLTTELLGFIRDIQSRYALTIVVVEHDMSLIMRLCDRIQVLNYGQTICEGRPEQVRANPAVIEAYLGTRREHQSA